MKYSLGANVVETEAFSIDKIMIGDLVLERVVAFAGDYKGSHVDDIILGTNVINNWEMNISKKKHTFQFRSRPPLGLKPSRRSRKPGHSIGLPRGHIYC